MKKGKNIFIVLWISILIVMSGGALYLYDKVNTLDESKIQSIDQYYQNVFQYMTLDLAMQLDSKYQPIQYKDDIKEENKINQIFNERIYDVRSFIQLDKDFFYIAKDLNTNRIITNIPGYNENTFSLDDYSYHINVHYDKQGIVKTSGSIVSPIFEKGMMEEILRGYRYLEEISEETINEKIDVVTPSQIEIDYIFSKEIHSLEGLSGYINSWERYSGFSAILLALMVCLLAVFIFIYPICYVAGVQPFKTVKQWYLEANILMMGILTILSVLAVIFVCGNTINGGLVTNLNHLGITFNLDGIILFVNMAVWLFALIVMSIDVFIVKYALVSGLWSYLKEHMLVIDVFRCIKLKINNLFVFDLNTSLNRHIVKYVICNGIVLVIICLMNSYLGLLLALIYSFGLFIWMNQRLHRIQKDYHTLLASIQHMIVEDFDEISEQDFGIFESSKAALNQLSQNFELAIVEKVKSQRMKTELISNVSHDLKTPLTCMKNYLELLKDDQLSNDKKHYYLKQLQKYTNRLKNLIDDLFEISKVDSGNIQLDLQPLNLVSLLEQAILENEDMLEAKQLTIVKNINCDQLILNMDSQKTYRVFDNLLTNINKYALTGSRVYIMLNDEQEYVDIMFSNISQEPMNFNVEEITERFVRGDESRSKQGSGLGLAIARSFIEAQGGSLNVSVDCDLFKVHIKIAKK